MTSTAPDSERRQKYAIFIISLCAAFLFFKYVAQNYPSIIATQLIAEFNLDGAALGNLAACTFYSYTLMQLFAGVLIDRCNFRLISAGAVAITALGVGIFAATRSLHVAEFSRVLIGLGISFATVIYLKAAANWFALKHYALVSGLLASAAMAGAVFGQAPLALAMDVFGWRSALLACSLVGLALALSMFFFLKNPEKAIPAQKMRFWDSFVSVLRNPQNWLLALYSGLTFGPLAVFGGLWGTPFFELAYHIPHIEAAFYVSMAFIGLGLGAPILGWLSNTYSMRSVMFGGNILALACLTLSIYIPWSSTFILGVLMFLFGFGLGVFMLAFSLGNALNPLYMAATVAAFINSGDGALDSITEPLIGFILDKSAHFHHPQTADHFQLLDYHLALGLLPLYLLIGTLLLKFINFHPHRSVDE